LCSEAVKVGSALALASRLALAVTSRPRVVEPVLTEGCPLDTVGVHEIAGQSVRDTGLCGRTPAKDRSYTVPFKSEIPMCSETLYVLREIWQRYCLILSSLVVTWRQEKR